MKRHRNAAVVGLGLLTGLAPGLGQAQADPGPIPSAERPVSAPFQTADDTLLPEHWPRDAALGLGLVLLSATLDRSGQNFSRDHGDRGGVKALANIGNALPVLALGGAGLAALASSDPRLSRTGWAAVEAGGASVLGGLGVKYALGRSRPDEPGARPGDFFSAPKRSDSSMPSIHTAAVWGAVTPFAQEYDQPWLYGAAALTNVARVAKNKHWVSDTVAGSLLGYGLGTLAWRWNRSPSGVRTSIMVQPHGVMVSLSY